MSKEPKNPPVSPDRRSFFDSLRVRTTLLILLVVIPLAVSVVVFFGYQANRIFRTDAEQSLEATARTLDSNVSIWLNLNIKALNQMVTLPDMISLDADKQKPILKLTSAAFPHLYLVHTTDVNGLNIARNDDGENQNYSDRLWYQGAVSGKPVQLQSLVSRTTGNPALLMATAIRDASGAIIGVGSFGGELDDIAREVNAQKVGNTGFAYIVDDTNRVVAHPDPTYTADLRDLSDYPPVVALRAGTRGLIDFTDAEGIKWIAYVDDIDYGWGVVVQQPEREVLAQARVFWQVTLLVAGVLVVMVSIAIWIVTQRITHPIVNLTEAASAISAGNLDQRVQVERMDEVGILGQAFNQMAEQVGGLLQTVQTRSVELEERTKELEASQRVTFAASEHATPDEMLDLVVNLIRDQFDLYHAQVYMVNEQEQAAVLRQSTGYAGRQLLQRKHHIPLDTTSLVTRAIHTGEAVLVDDVKADPNFLPNPLLPDTRSELVVPLKREGKVIGVLDAQDRTAGRFNPSTIALFQTMTDQVAILFENSELLQRVTNQTEVMGLFTNQLRTAADIARRLGTILDPEQLLQEVVELIQSRFGLYHAHIYLLDEEAEILKLATGSGEVGRVLRERGHSILMSAEKSLVARAARSRGAVLIADTTLESDFMPNPLLPQTRSELAIPLVVGDRVLGVLDMQDDQAGRFTEAERDTFSTLAGLVATAIQNARLVSNLQQREAFLQMQAQTLAELVSSPTVYSGDLKAALREITETTARVLSVARSSVWLYDENRAGIRCANLFEQGKGHSEGIELTAVDYPSYFKAIATERLIAATDAHTDAATREFSAGYLTPLGIGAMLDAPIVVAGQMVGVVCNEYVGGARQWQLEEQTFATSIADFVASAMEAQQRKQAEQRLRDTQQLLQSFLDNFPDTAWLKDTEGRFLLMNRYGLEHLIGGAEADVLGKTVYDIFTKEMADPLWESEKHLLATGATLSVEENVPHVDGHVYSKITTKFPLYDAQGNMTGLGGVLVDITERKQIETTLQENEEKFRALYESTADALMLFTSDGFIDCNPRTLEIFGFESKEQFINTHPGQLSPPFQPDGQDSMSASQEQIKIAYQQGFNRFEWVHRRINGEDFPAEVLTSAFTIGGQQMLQATVRDITDRKQAEAEIQKRASELQTVAEVGTAAATILESDRLLAQVVELTKTNFGLYHAHIYLIDEAGESLVLAAGAGEAGAQMKAQGWKIAADSETSLVARAFRTRQGVIVNDVRAAPDFLPNPLLPDTHAELAVPLIVGERVLGVLDVQSDQMDRFTREDVAIQTTLAGQIAAAIENARLFQETRELDRLKGEFLANMSHELRTPLNSIIGYIQLLLMDLEGEIPEDSYEDMKSVDTNSKHLLNLINDVLDLARIEAGRMELHMENITVPTLLDTVKSNNAGLFIDSALTLAIETEPDLPQIYADQIRITQVLNNLISNAFKFTETGSITVRAYRKDNEVCIAIEDTGIGIAEKDLDAVFERFRQVDGSFTRRAEGTGLGLSITRLLVELHNGRLTVRSKFGEGSTFTIHLPAVE